MLLEGVRTSISKDLRFSMGVGGLDPSGSAHDELMTYTSFSQD